MRCYVCNCMDAEHFDPRDNTFLCAGCKSDVEEIVYQWAIDDEEQTEWELFTEDEYEEPEVE